MGERGDVVRVIRYGLGVLTGLVLAVPLLSSRGESTEASEASEVHAAAERDTWGIRERLVFADLMAYPKVPHGESWAGKRWELQQRAVVPKAVLSWVETHVPEPFRLDPNTLAPAPDSASLSVTEGKWIPDHHRGPLARSVLDGGLELYRLELNHHQVGSDYWFFLRDTKSGEISARPFILDGRWMAGRIPKVERMELDGQGRQEIVCEGFGHNGTVYSALKSYFLEILDGLELKLVLELDDELEWPLGGQPGDVFQRLTRLGPNELALEGRWINSLTGAPAKLIGRAQRKRAALGEPFRITSREDFVEDANFWVTIR